MTYEPALPFHHTSGPHNARMVLVGEAWGEQEQIAGKPFAGESGKELFRMLGEAMPDLAPELHAEICAQHKYGLAWLKSREAWLAEAGILLTNVFAFRPSTGSNKLEAICYPTAKDKPDGYPFPALDRGLYLRTDFFGEVDRLIGEIQEVRPNIVVALGNVACWAIFQATNISAIRGAVSNGNGALRSRKVLATYHPAAILRQWNWRPIVVADLMKARREACFAEIRRPARRVLINPTLVEIEAWITQCLAQPPSLIACDTETEIGQIKCVGFARSRDDAMVIPLWDKERGSVWGEEDEVRVWDWVARLLESGIEIVWQNGMYDLQYMLKHGIRPRNNRHDTMLLHHSIFPELQKGLGFLGSIYTNEASWKLMRRKAPDTEKRDE